ncbi:hypothetical protein L7F22_054288 [Adiantum nelumboides]|nr:hypothetical protein [Adiantum nelumboides]
MTSNFWKGLFENLGTRLNFSSAYHPQTDGQSEIANLAILDLLKSYVTEVDQRSQWEKYLPLVEYAYNNTVHTSTGKAPFEVIEGRSKSPLLLKVHGKIFAADEYSRDLKESFQKIKEAISISQQKQKAAANKHRRALAFKENDWVLLKFPKARLRHTLGKNPTGHQKYYAKLAKRYYGPFQILKPINEMAYQLKLPNHWLIHNAFHVSLLKPYKGEPPSEAIMEDPPEVEDQEEVLQPKSILRHEDKVLRHDLRVKNEILNQRLQPLLQLERQTLGQEEVDVTGVLMTEGDVSIIKQQLNDYMQEVWKGIKDRFTVVIKHPFEVVKIGFISQHEAALLEEVDQLKKDRDFLMGQIHNFTLDGVQKVVVEDGQIAAEQIEKV